MADNIEDEGGDEVEIDVSTKHRRADSTVVSNVATRDEAGLIKLLERQSLVIDAIAEKLRVKAQDADNVSLLKGKSINASNVVWQKEQPPVPGAKLGRDPDGRPGWYVEDPDQEGVFVILDET